MADTAFFTRKYTLDTLVNNYLEEIKKLRAQVKNPGDETKLQIYYQAANTFSRVNTMELYQFARSYGKDTSGKTAAMRKAFPTLLGNHITQASQLDAAYLHLLLAYLIQFKQYRSNLKEWLLRFILSSPFSPLSAFVEREINSAIANTNHKIAQLQATLK